MATFLLGSLSHQKENLPTSYLVDQKAISCVGSTSNPDSSMIYLNQPSAGEFSEILSGSSLSLQNCVQIPSVGGRSEMSFIPPTSDTVTLHSVGGRLNIATSSQICNPLIVNPQVIPRTRPSILDGEHSFQSQGLSLSLGTQIHSAVPLPSFQYQCQGYSSLFSNYLPFSGKGDHGDESKGGIELRISDGSFAGGSSNAFDAEPFTNSQGSVSQKGIHSSIYQYEQGFSNTILNSKYLKAAQELLDEVVNVRKALKQPDSNKDQSSQPKSAGGMAAEPSDSITNSSSELSPAERQELQTKKTKLLSMLDEVDRRYKQYHHQMKIVVSSFDMVAGHGAAKPYTALALQTISQHFRCLRDAINDQLQAAQRTLGEQETSSNSQGGIIPRLRYVDHQLRQQRALQQLGVMRHAWRPQRGLPESSVSILRAWLFEHFLHPYPKDSEKIMLAKQTGLTRNQVANWFINARVRLWKPMIEDMHKEEFGEMEANLKSSPENAAKAPRENSSASEDGGEDLQENMTSKVVDTDGVQSGQIQQFNTDSFLDGELNRPIERSVYQNNVRGLPGLNTGVMKFSVDQRPNPNGSNLYGGTIIPSSQSGSVSLMAGDAMYDLPELNDFGVSSQVSLALGLRHHEDNNRVAPSMGPETVDFHCMDPGNQQDRQRIA
ncbi:hypothetical protein SLE2022_216420 [Rubroshorea leprosula]